MFANYISMFSEEYWNVVWRNLNYLLPFSVMSQTSLGIHHVSELASMDSHHISTYIGHCGYKKH